MTPARVTLAPNLTIPIDVMTETIAVLGIRGSGKTNTCVVMTEELLDAGQQVIVIDPTDAWWGLRSSKDGARGAYPIVVFGGRHGDVPLNAGDGAVVADAIVDNRIPAILSLRHFESQTDQRRLVTDFARRIYHRKGEAGRDTPMLLVIDEAHLFCPQRVGAAEAQMVGAIQKIVRQGRSSGLGVALIDQRAASVNKDLLTQLELLVCHRTSSPQDRKALEAWIEQHDTGDHKGKFLEQLPALERGTAWFWSPGWLNLFKEVHVRERRTFDSSATPKAGERVTAPSKLAEIDLDALRSKLAATIEKAEADDPRKLRARIADLERTMRADAQSARVEVERVEVPVISDEDIAELRHVVDAIERLKEEVSGAVHRATEYIDVIRERALFFRNIMPKTSVVPAAARAPMVGARNGVGTVSSRHAEAPKSAAPHGGNDPSMKIGGGERACMIAIAQHDDGVTREQLTQLTGYKRSTRDAYVQRLAKQGFVNVGAQITATRAGTTWLGSDYEPLPVGDDLRKHWLDRLPEGEKRVLEFAAAAYPAHVTREAITAETKYKRSTRDAYVQRLIARRLVRETGRGQVRAVETLFS